MLLPLARHVVNHISLSNHLALAVCRKGQGSGHLLNELIKAVYLTYFLQQSGFGDAPLDLYRRAEAVLEEAGWRAQEDGRWGVTPDAASTLEEILALHDQQLALAATWHVDAARHRLSKFIASDLPSPLPKDALNS